MPRWKALPDELDPQVREFAGQLRRLIDRSGLGVAAVADRTGYSRTSWERYLNGRLLAPRGAIVALAEATGTDQVHLTTMWELAERAWCRAEMRHDMTMEGIRIAQARAALGEFGPAPADSGGSRRSAAVTDMGLDAGAVDGGRAPSAPTQRGNVPLVPRQPPARPGAADAAGRADGQANGYAGGYGPGAGVQPPQAQLGDGRRERADRRKRTVILAGAVGALLVMAAAVLLTGLGDDDKKPGATSSPSTSPSPTAGTPGLSAGVKCSGADCTGQDPEKMGCGGRFARTVSSVTVGGSLVEVRYSETCGAAWGRITDATPGDTVRISGGGVAGRDGTVETDTDAYTPMIAVKKATDAKACAVLAAGTKGCTTAAAE
ncbi:XRE family transcriptional regulator [Streptomyces sp. JH14]|uniref:XRE family transcriptional regulator n=1 Tax=Streptomyces sp. JH14 TaxID=2793630 RepID=UPI0023F8A04B|nr:XRE family transcriptional regulator [Streptomyces sp. JH14]MDF6044382.1 XRE family transcriptional regulator [Streptomyces sp. JH14]